MLVTAKADYAVRAAVEIAAEDETHCITAEEIARRQAIPLPFLIKILQQLRVAGLTRTVRGPVGGHRLGRPAAEISIADVVHAIDGSFASVHGVAPEQLQPTGRAAPVAAVWSELHHCVESLLEGVTLADIVPPRDRAPAPGEGHTVGASR
jgi:Rrf2 family protein